jgi:hypothetical protein
MIRPDQIPDEVVEALCNHVGPVMTRDDWHSAFAAGLNAWPNAIPTSATDHLLVARPALILPLPKDAADE